jgi:hypothetical protein
MESKSKMVAEARIFLRLVLFSFAGLAFYYAHLFFGVFTNPLIFKALAVTFLLATLPLPIIALNNKKLFPEVRGMSKTALNVVCIFLFAHHFLMTFIFVLILQGGRI